MQVTTHQEQFLKQVASHNIRFQSFHWALGSFSLEPGQIEAFTNDPDSFVADQLGVTVEHLRAWGEFSESSQCIGTTSKNERCKSMALDAYRVSAPSQFVATNPDCFCATHGPVTLTITQEKLG
ncbi:MULTISPECIES: hypothetical protein [Pseudomonas]|uniref:Uncharacterized protein n=1 Tax=Pseudomonas fluorescens TaxID=294 RepID=A0A161ZAG9_PSEFL|nr:MULTISPECIES: hypothetical protein [Pseudomonas]KZN20707.1 hypothetical protein A1D17_03970 [Pseudomonas fluorescens]